MSLLPEMMTACVVWQGVLYWMWRDKRVQDNWALLYSQKVALQLNVPLQVCHDVFYLLLLPINKAPSFLYEICTCTGY
jgi:hypothetical protein